MSGHSRMFQPNREEIRMEIAGVNSLVTGAAAGIGRETALALARAGSHVTAVDVDAKGLAELAREASQAGLIFRR